MHFLITGATGFIGRAVVAEALRQGHRVTALVRRPVDIPGVSTILCTDLATADITASDYDGLIHLAWANVGNSMNAENLLSDVREHHLFLTKLMDEGLLNITVAGTCLEYGMQQGALAETAMLQPTTYYGLAKITLHRMLSIHAARYPEACLKWLRYFYVYGENQRPNALLPQLLKAIANGDDTFNMSPGDQKRDFIQVNTAAYNTVLLATSHRQGTYNVGSGRAISVRDFVENVLEIKRAKLQLNAGYYPYLDYEPFSFHANMDALASIPGAKIDEAIWL